MSTQFKHLRFNPQLKPMLVKAVTIAVAANRKGKLFIGVATCSGKDNFSREKGRDLASKRLLSEMASYNTRSCESKKRRAQAKTSTKKIVSSRKRGK